MTTSKRKQTLRDGHKHPLDKYLQRSFLLTAGTSCHAKTSVVCPGCSCLSLFHQKFLLCMGLGIFSAASYLEIKTSFSPKFTYIGPYNLTIEMLYTSKISCMMNVCVCVCLCLLLVFHLWNTSHLTSERCGESKGHWGHAGLCLQTSFQLLKKEVVSLIFFTSV